jgi:Uma2 family endonuclease
VEYHRLNERNENGRRTELMRGIVIEKMSKSPLHSSIAKWLYDALNALVPEGFIVRHEDPITLADSEPEPDIAVVTGPADRYLSAHPTTAVLIVEVAVSSPALDGENASLYAEADVKEYWIVLGRERQIEVYRQPENGRFGEKRIFAANDLIECSTLPTVRLRFSDFETRLSDRKQP